MINRRNYYRLLQVQPDAPFEVIRASYRALLKELKVHPDLGGDHWNAKVLNEAYSTLSDRYRRSAYDKKLYEKYTKKPFRESTDQRMSFVTFFCPFCKRLLACQANPNERCATCRSPLKSFDEEELQQSCRRTIARRKKSGKINYFTTWPQKGQPAEIIDISPAGMRFRCGEKLNSKSVIKISGSYLKAIAEVKHSYKLFFKGKTIYTVGVHFCSVTFSNQSGAFYSATA
ncbi:J domain-containing protein [candidate division KSB1 bacterium]|nr:J domain-containing protein [candidate division KSB1 bacterium]